VEDVEKARKLAFKLKNDIEFYNMCSSNAKLNYKQYYNDELWKNNIINFINNA